MYQNKKITLGFIGLGLMGMPMTLRLLMADYNVNVWNRSEDKTKEVAKAGALACSSPAEVATKSNMVFLCLANTKVVEDIVSDSAFRSALNKNKIIIDLSSISPESTRKLATEIETQSQCPWVDAPVSGGIAGAEQGTLVIMAGGDATVIDQVRPILAALSTRVTHMGDIGAGQATKLCNQIIVGCNITAISEAMRLAENSGVDVNQLPHALAGGFADSLPFQIFGKRMAERTFDPPSIKIDTMLKDLNGAITAAKNENLRLSLTEQSAQILAARSTSGVGEQCITSLIEPSPDKIG